MKILIALDGSPSGDAVLDEVVERLWPEGSLFRVVTVMDSVPTIGTDVWAVPPTYIEEFAKAMRRTSEQIIEAAHGRLASIDPERVSFEVLVGTTAQAIIEEAERWGADLVMVGSHGRGAFERFLLGSVSSAVALHAPCSVEVVRQPKAPASE